MALKRKKAPKKPRNRKAQEATLINNDARKKDIAKLQRAVKEINSQLAATSSAQTQERLDNQERTLVSVQKTLLAMRDDIGKLASMGARIVTLEEQVATLNNTVALAQQEAKDE